jgi:hypothetical protein
MGHKKGNKLLSSKTIQSSLFLFFLCAGLLIGCTTKNSLGYSQTNHPTVPIVTITPSLTVTPNSTVTPTIQKITPTWTNDPKFDPVFASIKATQAPLQISTSIPADSPFLYQNLAVTIDLVDMWSALAYLNLDDINNNKGDNSDIVIRRAIGNPIIFYTLDPSNYARYYYMGNNQTDFDSCKKELLNIDLDMEDYLYQSDSFIDGGNYCILTNEGRIAIVNYIDGSLKSIGTAYEEHLSVNITVYRQIIN